MRVVNEWCRSTLLMLSHGICSCGSDEPEAGKVSSASSMLWMVCIMFVYVGETPCVKLSGMKLDRGWAWVKHSERRSM